MWMLKPNSQNSEKGTYSITYLVLVSLVEAILSFQSKTYSHLLFTKEDLYLVLPKEKMDRKINTCTSARSKYQLQYIDSYIIISVMTAYFRKKYEGIARKALRKKY